MRKKPNLRLLYASTALALLAVLGCSEAKDASSPALHPLLDAQSVEDAEAQFDGHVTQRIPAGGYTYIEVQTGSTRHWVATLGGDFSPGERVQVNAFAARDDFHSNRLSRRFDRVLFGVVHK